jgi:S-DNA-T family DNA segregation ATPase FtsK/SpoIIIE
MDSKGAEQLIGMGDMLISTGSDLTRLQCAFIDTPDVDAICDYIGSQRAYPDAHMLPEYVGDTEVAAGDVDLDQRDAMFEDAARVVVKHQSGSTSMIQRRLKLGYNRAGRIIDELEAAGIVGPFEGSKARHVLIKDELALKEVFNQLNNKDEF